MMWNTAWGITGQGGMMGVITRSNGTMTVSKEKATGIAQSWLDGHLGDNVTRAPGDALSQRLQRPGLAAHVDGRHVQTKDLGK